MAVVSQENHLIFSILKSYAYPADGSRGGLSCVSLELDSGERLSWDFFDWTRSFAGIHDAKVFSGRSALISREMSDWKCDSQTRNGFEFCKILLIDFLYKEYRTFIQHCWLRLNRKYFLDFIPQLLNNWNTKKHWISPQEFFIIFHFTSPLFLPHFHVKRI